MPFIRALWFCLFFAAVNLHVPDLGETYVSRNLFVWVFIALTIFAVWYRPLLNNKIRLNWVWAVGAFGVPIGGIFVVLATILINPAFYHFGHYFLPFIALLFGLLHLGLMQHDTTDQQWAMAIIACLLAFLPQFALHVISTNPIVFFPVHFEIHQIFFKEHMGFGQYNLYGVVLVSLLSLTLVAASKEHIKSCYRNVLLAFLFLYSLELPSLDSKTALVGFLLSLFFFALFIYQSRHQVKQRRRFALAFLIMGVGFTISALVLYFSEGQVSRSSRWSVDGNSVQTRLAMWVIAWHAFLDAPLFGHGLGSFTRLYTDYYAQFGLEKGLEFYPTVSLPHNLVMHLLSETGLFGFLMILGPLLYFAGKLLLQKQERFLTLALVTPVLFHSLLEYPYIASSMHYLLLAVGLVMGVTAFGNRLPNVNLEEKKLGSGRIYLAGIAIFALISCLGAGHMQWVVYKSAVAFSRDARLPLDEFMRTRFSSEDVRHPVIGYRMLAMSYLVLGRKAVEAKEIAILQNVVVPSLEKHIIPVYNNNGVWEITLRTYFEVGQFDKAYALVDRIALFDPKRAGQYRVILDRSLKDYEVRPTRPQQ